MLLFVQVENKGCGEVKDMNTGLKYVREVFFVATQKSIILDFTSLLHECLVSGFCKSCRGEGRA